MSRPGLAISINQIKNTKLMSSALDKSFRFSHMKRGAAQRDLTSAIMCAFRLVSGNKTWPAKPTRLGSIGTHVSDNNNQINHAHAGVSELSWYWWAVGSVSGPGSTLVHWFEGLQRAIAQPGFCTVKLDRGVKVEKPNKHEVGTRYHALSPVSFPRLDTVKPDKEENCPRSEVS